MSDAQEYLRRLVEKSPPRLRVLEAVYSMGNSFTVQDVLEFLRQHKVKYSNANVSTTLRGLCVRGLLTQYEDRPKIQRGALTIHYQKINTNKELI